MRVCLVKTSALGDIVQTFSVLSYLKWRNPLVTIDWVVESKHAGLVAAHPSVHQVISVDTSGWRRKPLATQTRHEIQVFRQAVRKEPYQVVFDLQGNLKSGLLLSQIASDHKVGFARRTVAEWPNLLFTNQRWNPEPGQNICTDYLSVVKHFFRDDQPFFETHHALNITLDQNREIDQILQGGKIILVSPGSAWRNKQLPLATLSLFLQRIAKATGSRFLFSCGSDEEHDTCKALHLLFPEYSAVLPRHSLAFLQNLMQRVALVISMDSLPLHLAASVGTPTFAFFGPSSALKYNPLGSMHEAYQGSCPYGRTFTKRCPILRTCPTGACLRDQPADKLFEAFIVWYEYEFLSDGRPRASRPLIPHP